MKKLVNINQISNGNRYCEILQNELETKKIAKELISIIPDNETIVLTGGLAAGKTKFTEGILELYGYEDQISSPTFTIVNEYMNYEDESKKKIYHFDVYRLENYDEFYDMGGDEYIGKNLCILEWGEIISDILEKYVQVNLSKIDDTDKRKIEIYYVDRRKNKDGK